MHVQRLNVCVDACKKILKIKRIAYLHHLRSPSCTHLYSNTFPSASYVSCVSVNRNFFKTQHMQGIPIRSTHKTYLIVSFKTYEKMRRNKRLIRDLSIGGTGVLEFRKLTFHLGVYLQNMVMSKIIYFSSVSRLNITYRNFGLGLYTIYVITD